MEYNDNTIFMRIKDRRAAAFPRPLNYYYLVFILLCAREQKPFRSEFVYGGITIHILYPGGGRKTSAAVIGFG